jgi:DNA sulfur modification protein DndC
MQQVLDGFKIDIESDVPRMTIEESIELSIASLTEYHARGYRHWIASYSGGKDSTVVVTLIDWLLREKLIPRPESYTVMYADTLMELPPIVLSARQMLRTLSQQSVETQTVTPALDRRWFVNMLGRGLCPPNSKTNRWCTRMLKAETMEAAKQQRLATLGIEEALNITGVRLGESAVRDATIAKSCSKDGGECGQGWFHHSATGPALAPIVHWRLCLVEQWLVSLAPQYGYDTVDVIDTYSFALDEETEQQVAMRTGCVSCALLDEDHALARLCRKPHWAYLEPLKKLTGIYNELRQPRNRLRKHGEINADGRLSAKPNRMGALTLEARLWALGEVLEIQRQVNDAAQKSGRPEMSLINTEEEQRIRELISKRTFPQKWTGDEYRADVLVSNVFSNGIEQHVLFPGYVDL